MSRETWTAESAIRDPRIHPCTGDEIIQRISRIPIKVIAVSDTHVEWQEWTPRRQTVSYNKWTIRGWREVVAKDADIITRAKALEDET